jgi:hypothetical protein
LVGSVPYIPGHIHVNFGPLTRFLPPSSLGSTETWLNNNIVPGSWVLDPFGSSPYLSVEAALAGYRVLVTANNPISRILIKFFANPVSETDLQSALAELAASLKGDERIENHIQSLYQTICPHCQKEIFADAYIWDYGDSAPSIKIYNCPFCKEKGEHLVDQTDMDRAMKFRRSGLHWSRALERIASFDDPDRLYIEKALDIYLPRAVYVLVTLINKLDSLTSHNRIYLVALLLAAFDKANKMWPYPVQKYHPRSLRVPRRFYEHNIWVALEEAISFWVTELKETKAEQSRIPFSTWPQTPPESGGICLYEGNLKELIARTGNRIFPDENINAVMTTVPRPNQAYWTLSTLWSGWLWGRKSVIPYKRILRRRRYGWAWHTSALNSVFRNISHSVQPNTPFIGSIGTSETRFINAAIIAAWASGFNLSGIAMRIQDSHAQISWDRSQPPTQEILSEPPPTEQKIHELIRQTAKKHLLERGEPSAYVNLHTASLVELLGTHKFISYSQNFSLSDLYSQIHNNIKEAFSNQDQMISYSKGDRSFESGLWWFSERFCDTYADKVSISLADRVEYTIIEFLRKHSELIIPELEKYLCNKFPGLFTPDLELIRECAYSYCDLDTSEGSKWCLRNQETQERRDMDIQNMQLLITQIGDYIGYDSTLLDLFQPQKELFHFQEDPFIKQPVMIKWESNGEVRFIFYVIFTGMIGKTVFKNQLNQENQYPGNSIKRILVIPGGRASLVRFKINRDPRLKQATQLGWYFIKYRHVRRLAENEYLSKENFFDQLSQDPLANIDPQMSLL